MSHSSAPRRRRGVRTLGPSRARVRTAQSVGHSFSFRTSATCQRTQAATSMTTYMITNVFIANIQRLYMHMDRSTTHNINTYSSLYTELDGRTGKWPSLCCTSRGRPHRSSCPASRWQRNKCSARAQAQPQSQHSKELLHRAHTLSGW